MRQARRALLWTLVFALWTFLACAPASAPAPAPASDMPSPGGVLNIRTLVDPANWDVHETRSVPNSWGVAQAYSSLLAWKFGPQVEYTEMVFQPELAERWEVSPDAQTFTFHLRKGVRFHNLAPVSGRELTSADVKFSAEYGGRLGELKEKRLPVGEQDYIWEGLERIDTPDAYTVTFRFKAPYVPYLSYAASDYFPIMPREIFDQDGGFRNLIAGSGPYMLDTAASQKGTRWVWKKNPAYFEAGKPYVDEVRWLVLPQESTMLAAFQTRQLDLIHDGQDVREARELAKSNPQAVSYRWLQARHPEMWLSQLPSRNSPVRDIRVRRAVALAIDHDEINRTLFAGEAEFGVPGAMPGLFTQAEAKQMTRHDPSEARRLLAEAGYVNGVSLEYFLAQEVDQTRVSLAELLQAQLKRAGIDLQIKVVERTQQRQIRRSYNFDIDMDSIGRLHDDPDSQIMGHYYGTARGNYSQIKDPALDRLLESSRRELDPEKRREILRSISKHLVDNVYAIRMLAPPQWSFWHPSVQNYRPHFGSRADYVWVWLNK